MRYVRLYNRYVFQFLLFLLYTVPTFITIYYGADAVQSLIANIPGKWITGLAVVGGMLPAVGIGMLLNYMGKRQLVPYFLIGFLLMTYLELPITVIALFGLAAAYLHIQHAGGVGHEPTL